MKVFSLLYGTRVDRRAYAAALAGLARRGHEVTLAVPPFVRAFEPDVPGVRLLRLSQAPGDIHERRAHLIEPYVVHDFTEQMAFSRAAYEACAGADALLLDVATGDALIPALSRAPRKVALLLDSYPELAQAAEPNLADEDHARFIAHRCVVELSERECHATVVPFAASLRGGRSARPDAARVLPPAVDPGWAEQADLRLFELVRRPLVAAIGAWVPAHGFHVAVEALRELRRAFPDATLVTAGESYYGFGARREFRFVAVDRFLGGARDAVVFIDDGDATLRALLRAADVLVHPVLEPGAGTAILEALSAGVPVVASAIDAHREWLEDGREALLVPPGDARALADGVQALLRDRDRARSLAARGRDLLAARFRPERLVDGLEEELSKR